MAISKWITFGQQASTSSAASAQVGGPLVAVVSSADSKEFGLENFGNTCYANSVLQTLYFCNPFRELLLQLPDPSVPPEPLPTQQPPPPAPSPQPAATVRRKPERKSSASEGRTASEIGSLHLQNAITPTIPSSPPTLASALRSLFVHISKNPADKGTVAPRAFIEKLRQLNELFRSQMHQDAHEFLNYLLNKIVEEIDLERRHGNDPDLSASLTPVPMGCNATATLVHKLFEGVLTSETRCLTCETVSSRDESFLDLSIDIEQNSSVTACLRQFSASEMLCQKNKFFCDSCCDLQEAEKRMKIKKLPNVLALHLKRFKYQEEMQKYIKLTYRVAFPMELRLFNTVDDAENPDRLYELYGIVVHIGNGPHHGHYVSIIKANGSWKIFDDDTVDTIKECDIPKYFGDSNNGAAYVLYYQAVDLDLPSLGLQRPTPTSPKQPVPKPSSEELPIPALPPGLTSENDLSDVAESSGPTTPAASNPGYSPKIAGSPVPLKVNIPPSDLPPPMASLPTTIPPQKPGGGLFRSVRTTIGTSDHRKSPLDAASMVASSSSAQNPAPPSYSKSISRPVTAHGNTGGVMPALNEPPPLPPSLKAKPVNGKDGWFKRKSVKQDKEKEKLASYFATTRLERDKDKQDDSAWLKAPDMSQNHVDPTKSADSHSPAPSPVSTVGSTSPRSGSPTKPSPSPEPNNPLNTAVELPPVKITRPLPQRPSTAGARVPGSVSTLSLKVSPGLASDDPPPLPPIPPRRALPDPPQTPDTPLTAPEIRKETIALHENLPTTNENGHRKRPSSAHANVSPGFAMTHSLSSAQTNEAMHALPVSADYKPMTNGSNNHGTWKRATRKLSLTGTMLGFGKKEKHRDRLGGLPSATSSSPPSSFYASTRH